MLLASELAVLHDIIILLRHIFSACPVWISTQSNTTNIISFTCVHSTTMRKNHDCALKIEIIALISKEPVSKYRILEPTRTTTRTQLIGRTWVHSKGRRFDSHRVLAYYSLAWCRVAPKNMIRLNCFDIQWRVSCFDVII